MVSSEEILFATPYSPASADANPAARRIRGACRLRGGACRLRVRCRGIGSPGRTDITRAEQGERCGPLGAGQHQIALGYRGDRPSRDVVARPHTNDSARRRGDERACALRADDDAKQRDARRRQQRQGLRGRLDTGRDSRGSRRSQRAAARREQRPVAGVRQAIQRDFGDRITGNCRHPDVNRRVRHRSHQRIARRVGACHLRASCRAVQRDSGNDEQPAP
jgi:hypothetical protein